MPEQKTNASRQFPKWKYHRDGQSKVVNDADEEAAMGEAWRDSPAGPFGPPAGSDPLRWFDSWDLQRLSPEAKVRIAAGLLDAHADVVGSSREDGSRVRQVSRQKAFDVFANEYLAAGLLTKSMLMECIPQNVYDAAVSGGWETGTLEKNSGCTLKFGHYWAAERVYDGLRELFAPQVLRWQAKILLSKKVYAGKGSPGAEGPAQPVPETCQTGNPITAKGDKRRARRHGYKADMDRHNAVANVVEQHYAPWRNRSFGWRKDSVLKSICTDLDRREIDIPESWRTGTTMSLKGTKLKNWSDALNLGYKRLIVDNISYSLGMVLKETIAASGETKRPT